MRLALLIALLFFAFVPTVYAATGLTLEIFRGEGAIHNVRECQFVLVSEGKKLVPSITRVFRKDQSLYVYFEVCDTALNGTASEIRATVALSR